MLFSIMENNGYVQQRTKALKETLPLAFPSGGEAGCFRLGN